MISVFLMFKSDVLIKILTICCVHDFAFVRLCAMKKATADCFVIENG